MKTLRKAIRTVRRVRRLRRKLAALAAAVATLTALTNYANDLHINPTEWLSPQAAQGETTETSNYQINGEEIAAAADELASLRVAAPSATMDSYDRDLFGPAWDDTAADPQQVAFAANGCDTRNDILARDLTGVATDDGCTVTSGDLWDPYTATTINFTRGARTSSAAQIDHIVALGNVWISGGSQLDPQARANIANDPINLLAVDGPTNGAKGDSSADAWMPPNEKIHCYYAASQIRVKAKYGLTVTQAEHDALQSAINSCPAGI